MSRNKGMELRLFSRVWGLCLEDHPMTCKWLIAMVIVSPLSRVVGPLPSMAELYGL